MDARIEVKKVYIPVRQGEGFSRDLVECVDDFHYCRMLTCGICPDTFPLGYPSSSDRVLASRYGGFDRIGLPIYQGPVNFRRGY